MKLYDFKLNVKQEQRAKELHNNSIIMDMLYQGPVSPTNFPKHVRDKIFEKNKRYAKDFSQAITRAGWDTNLLAIKGEFPEFEQIWRESGVTAGNRQLIGAGVTSKRGTLEGLYDAALLLSMQFESFDWMIKATKADDIRKAKKEGKFAGFVTTQDTIEFGTDIGLLEKFYDFGLRIIQLTYSPQNLVGSGCSESDKGGLSNLGAGFVKKMNELGILIDTGHCNKQTILDACKVSSAPIITSHTAIKSVYNHTRAKDDETLKAVANTGGVIGIVVVPEFIGSGNNVTMEHFLDHMDYLVKLVGIEHVGIGTDWPMCMPDYAQEMMSLALRAIGHKAEDDVPSLNYVNGFENYTDYINITRGLVSRGYSDDDIRLILGENWLRVFEKVCG